MKDRTVSIRDVRNQGRAVMDRVLAGEHLTVTRSGKPVAELRPLPRQALPADALLRRWRALPAVDAAALRADIDTVVDDSL